MVKIEYQGTDITDSVTVARCWIDQYAEEHGDTIKIIFNDVDGLWDSWGPSVGDKIRVYNGNIDSGIQYVRRVHPTVGRFEIDASAIPPTAGGEKKKEWKQITKLQLANDIAGKCGLSLKTYGLKDCIFKNLKQDYEEDLKFFQKLCMVEGDAFLIYNGQMVLYNESYMENQSPAETIGLDMDNYPEYWNKRVMPALTVRNDSMSYTYGSGSPVKVIYVPLYIDSQGTAEKYAKNLFHYYDKMKKGGFFYYRSPLDDGYAAGSIAEIKTDNRPSYDGKAFIYHVRFDTDDNRAKVFFRCL